MLDNIVEKARSRRSYLGGKVSIQSVLNGMVIWLASLSDNDQTIVLDRALELCGMLEQDLITVEQIEAMGSTIAHSSVSVRTWQVNQPAPVEAVKKGLDGDHVAVGKSSRGPRKK